MRYVHKPRESRSYQIYALIDPGTNKVRYVGMSFDAYLRFYYGHMVGHSGSEQVNQWIAELRQRGRAPVLEVLETLDASVNSLAVAHERERYWIAKMERSGYRLLNTVGSTRSREARSRSKPNLRGDVLMQDEELLTVDDAAKIMKVHPRTIRVFVNSGNLAIVEIGKREYRIRRSELNRFIREKEERRG